MDEKRLAEIERRMETFGEYCDSGKCFADMRALITEVRELHTGI